MKEMINKSTAHPNIAYTNKNVCLADSGENFSTPFFEIEDEYFVKADLLMASKIALSLTDLFYGVNEDVNAIVWRDDFHSQFDALSAAILEGSASLSVHEVCLQAEQYINGAWKKERDGL